MTPVSDWDVPEVLPKSPCPSWCDGSHSCVAEISHDGQSLDVIHTSTEMAFGTGGVAYLEQHAQPDGVLHRAVTVVGDPRLTPDEARHLGSELVRLADLLDAAAYEESVR